MAGLTTLVLVVEVSCGAEETARAGAATGTGPGAAAGAAVDIGGVEDALGALEVGAGALGEVWGGADSLLCELW